MSLIISSTQNHGCGTNHQSDTVPSLYADLSALSSQSTKSTFAVYVLPNDHDISTVQKAMGNLVPENGAHIGCSGWHNLDIIAHRRSNFGLIADLNPGNRDLIVLTKEIILKSTSREDFVRLMGETLTNGSLNLAEHGHTQTIAERIHAQLTDPQSWLGDDNSFAYIAKMFREDRILAIATDLTNVDSFKKIRTIFDRYKFVVDTLYLCNVRYFLRDRQQEDFAVAMNQLLQPSTYVIHCPEVVPSLEGVSLPLVKCIDSLRQHLNRGEELLADQRLYFVRQAKDIHDTNFAHGADF